MSQMLSEDLQDEIKQLLAHVNGAYQKLLERAEQPNFEAAYDHTIYSDDEEARMVSELLWHDGEQVGKLTIRVEEYQHTLSFFGTEMGIWKQVEPIYPVILFSALSRSDAIRRALKEIETKKANFVAVFDPAPIPPPTGEGKQNEEAHVCGG
jgi:hypothetical protein